MSDTRARLPFVLAHRAGNDPGLRRRAEAVRPRLVEADLHLYAGRLEVRHLKALRPLPILIAVTAISGGSSFSMIPDTCTVHIDLRLTPAFTAADAQTMLEQAIDRIDAARPGRARA